MCVIYTRISTCVHERISILSLVLYTYEEEDTCAYEEEDTCAYEEEDTCACAVYKRIYGDPLVLIIISLIIHCIIIAYNYHDPRYYH